MAGYARLPPSPRERPPPAPYPSPPPASAAASRGLGAPDPSRPSAYRSLSSSLRHATHSAMDSRGDFATQVSASAYFDAPSHPPRASVEPARLTRSYHATKPTTSGHDDAWNGVYGDHGGVGKSAVRLSAVQTLARVLPEDTFVSTGAHVRHERTHVRDQELDVNTANVLAKQQAQLLELHAQVEHLKVQLTRSRGRSAGDFAGSGLDRSGGRDSSLGNSLRSSSEWYGRGPHRNAYASRINETAVDASTNTLWTPDVAASLERFSRFTGGARDVRDVDDPDETQNWSYEGGGRKSRGNMTDSGAAANRDGRGGASTSAFRAKSDDPLRRSHRSGLRVIRRSVVGAGDDNTQRVQTNDGKTAAPRLSPAKTEDVVVDARGASSFGTINAMPPLPVPSRPEMRVLRRRALVMDDETNTAPPAYAPPAYAPPPGATMARKEHAVSKNVATATATGGVFGATKLIPSRNSAFTPVAAEDPLSYSLDDPETRWRAAGAAAMRSTRVLTTPRVGGLGRGDPVRVSRERSVGASDDDVRLFRASDASSVNSAFGDHQHDAALENKMRVVAPARSFARVPLFPEGESSPQSPARDDDEDDADSEVLRVSRDTFAELSRGFGEGLANDRASGYDSSDPDDDATDAGTAVTGTTTGRGASEWALPTRWGAQRMSEAVCWDEEISHDAESSGTKREEDDREREAAVSVSPRRGVNANRDGAGSPKKLPRSPLGSPTIHGDETDEQARKETASATFWAEEMPEGMPTISYQPMSDDESSDDEEMRAIYAKYDIGATH